MVLRTWIVLAALWPLYVPAAEAMSYHQIDEAARTSTDAQWDELAPRFVGITVTWTGQVIEVSKNWLDDLYGVTIDMDRTGSSDVYFDVPREVALLLRKGGRYRFRGTIGYVGRMFGTAVTLESASFIRE